MVRERRAALAAALALALVVVLEFLPALSLGLMGDDFELLSLARIGGFAPNALVLPHRGAFVKPVLNAAWAAGASGLGANAAGWYTVALLVHLFDATLLGLLAYRLATLWEAGGRSSGSRAAATPWRLSAPLTGFMTALVWAVHDRLSEPVYSIASLNHSLTFALYLSAMLASVSAIATRASRARLLTALFVLLTLFSYEVGASALLALALLASLTQRGGVPAKHASAPGEAAAAAESEPGTPPRDGRDEGAPGAGLGTGLGARLAALGWPTVAAVAVWIVVQGISRLAPGAVSYYSLSPSVWLHNFAEIGLAFIHIPGYRIEPSLPWAILFAGLLLAVALWPRTDRVLRFGCAWTLAACLPVLPIPFFSDRYHYVVFAGIALALGRGAALLIAPRARGEVDRNLAARPAGRYGAFAFASPAGLALVAALAGAHVAVSVLGAREQAAYYGFKSRIPKSLLAEAEATDDAIDGSRAVLAILWRGDPGQLAAALQEAEVRFLKPTFSEVHPTYVRPQGILGVVYPTDLYNVAAAGSGRFYRRPPADRAARALMEGSLRLAPMGERLLGPEDRQRLAARLRETLLTQREIPLTLVSETPPAALGPWSVAWLETTDRAGAFEEEYGRARTAAAPPGAADRDARPR